MSDTKWTPSPWVVRHGRTPHVKEIVGPKQEAICATHHWLDSDPVEESRANANLIAAAPELYEALDGFSKLMALWMPSEDEYDEDSIHCGEYEALGSAAQKMSQALAKARGEALDNQNKLS